MQPMISDALAVIVACLGVAILASAIIIFRPSKRRKRHRKRHSHRPRIDLFAKKAPDPGPVTDA